MDELNYTYFSVLLPKHGFEVLQISKEIIFMFENKYILET